MPPKKTGVGKGYYMISAVATKYNIHPQTLRLYEREGLLKPSRTEGNTRLYSDEDVQTLETILALTRDLGVNLAGVEIVLNMRRKMERMQKEVNEFMVYVKKELARGLGDWEQRLNAGGARASARVAGDGGDNSQLTTHTNNSERGATRELLVASCKL
jgi:MerR family transcriptional regulator/heat shock protein HspR